MDEPAVGSLVGGVRLDEVIGRGGMGVVYRGHDPELNRTVAVKVVRAALAENDEFRRRFRRECEVAAAFDHPHVVPIYSAGEDNGRLYVVMRHVPGTDLRDAIREQGVADSGTNGLVVIDVATGHLLPSLALPTHVLGLVVAGGNVWVTSTDDSAPAEQRRLTITPVDKASMTPGPPLALHGAASFATDGVRLWAGYPDRDEMQALDPHTGAPLGAPVRGVSRGLSDVGVLGPDVWFADGVDSTVVRARLGG